MSRRAALGLLAGAAALVSRTGPSEAAFGDAANVFGRTTNKSGTAFAEPEYTWERVEITIASLSCTDS